MDDLLVILLISIITAIVLLYHNNTYHKQFNQHKHINYNIQNDVNNKCTINNGISDSLQQLLQQVFPDITQQQPTSNNNLSDDSILYDSNDKHSTNNSNRNSRDIEQSSFQHDFPVVYNAIQQLTDNIIHNFIHNWYHKVNSDATTLFEIELRSMLYHIGETISYRSVSIDWSKFVVRHIVIQLTHLLKVFRVTKQECIDNNPDFNNLSDTQQYILLNKYISTTYQLHPAVNDRKTYIRRLSAALLTQLLRPKDFNCNIISILCREILTFNVIQPSMNFVSSYWINTAIVKLLNKVNVAQSIDNASTTQAVQKVVESALSSNGIKILHDKHNYNNSITKDDDEIHNEKVHDHKIQQNSNNNANTNININQGPPQFDRKRSTSYDIETKSPVLNANIYSDNNNNNSNNTTTTLQYTKGINISHPIMANSNNNNKSVPRSMSYSSLMLDNNDDTSRTTRNYNNNNNLTINTHDNMPYSDIWSIRILSAEIRFDMKPYVVYNLYVKHYPTNTQWTTAKRYSQFLKLHKKLKHKYNSNVASFPKKHIFEDHLSQQFIQTRKAELAIYLAQLLWNRKIQQSDIWWKFLTPNTNVHKLPNISTNSNNHTTENSVVSPQYVMSHNTTTNNNSSNAFSPTYSTFSDIASSNHSLVRTHSHSNNSSPSHSRSNSPNRQHRHNTNSTLQRHNNDITQVTDDSDDERSAVMSPLRQHRSKQHNHSTSSNHKNYHYRRRSSSASDLSLYTKDNSNSSSTNQLSTHHQSSLSQPPIAVHNASESQLQHDTLHNTHGNNVLLNNNTNTNVTPLQSQSASASNLTVPTIESQPSKSRLMYYKSDSSIESNEYTQPLYTLIEEILDLNSKGYIGRKAVFIVRNVLKLTMNTYVYSWLNNSVVNALSQQQCAKLINNINNIVFPNGKLFTPAKPQTDREKYEIKLAAQDCVVHHMPSSIKTLLGTQHCQIAMLRVFEFLQNETLLRHLAFSILDALILELFPELNNIIE